MKITNFKKGDIITRDKPAKPYSPDKGGDRSYMGDKIRFIGVANGQIYFQMPDHFLFDSEKLFDLSMDIWADGWVAYQDPMELFGLNNQKELDLKAMSLEWQLTQALQNEDYELASKLRDQLKNK